MFLAKLIALTAVILVTSLPVFASPILSCSAIVYNKDDGTVKDSSSFLIDPDGSVPSFHVSLGGLSQMVIQLTEESVQIHSYVQSITTTLGDQKAKKYFFHPTTRLNAIFGNKNFFGTMTCAKKESDLIFKNIYNQAMSLDLDAYYEASFSQRFEQVFVTKDTWCAKSKDLATTGKLLQTFTQYWVSPIVTKTTIANDGSLNVVYDTRECIAYEEDSDTPAGGSCIKERVIKQTSVSIPACK